MRSAMVPREYGDDEPRIIAVGSRSSRPSSRCSPSRPPAIPDRDGLDLRAEVGRLPGARLPRRRRALHPVARPQAAEPLLPGARGAAAGARRPRRALRARRRGRHRHVPTAASTSTRCCCASTPRRRESRCWPRRRPPRSSPSTASPTATDDLREPPRSPSVARACERLIADPPASVRLTPSTDGPGDGAALVRRLRGRRPGRGDRASAPMVPYAARQARDGQDQARPHRRLRGRRVPLAQERAGHARRVAAAGPVERRREPAARRRHLLVHDGEARRAGRVPGAVPRGRGWRTTPGATGRPGRGRGRRARDAACPARTSRWNRGKDLSWEPVRPELVCEVAFDHLQGDRFRHAATFRRWRPDQAPADCRYDQLEETPAALLADLFGGR